MTPDQTPIPRVMPVSLRDPDARFSHVALRLKERGGVEWTPAQVHTLEKRIKMVRTMINLQKPVAPILPTKIGSEKEDRVHFYRVLIAGAPHVFVWSQLCRGIISYRGPGELIQPSTSAKGTPC